MDGKIYVGILVERVHKVTEGLIDDNPAGFRAGKGCVDEKAQEKKCSVICGFYRPGEGK